MFLFFFFFFFHPQIYRAIAFVSYPRRSRHSHFWKHYYSIITPYAVYPSRWSIWHRWRIWIYVVISWLRCRVRSVFCRCKYCSCPIIVWHRCPMSWVVWTGWPIWMHPTINCQRCRRALVSYVRCVRFRCVAISWCIYRVVSNYLLAS